MKINWHYEISIRWFRIPVIPLISLTEIKPEVEKPVPKRGSWAIPPVPEDAEAEILPIPAQTPATHVSDGRSYSERTYHPDKRYRRGSGPLAGTERYRATHVKRDLIQWFVDRKNKPLTETQMRTMKKSPFRHAWVKCEITCDHRIVSTSTLRRVLRNEKTAKEQDKGTPQVITFAREKKKFTLDKDFYKSLTKKTDTLAQIAESIPVITPPVQVPTETETEDSVGHTDVVIRAYIRENSDMGR